MCRVTIHLVATPYSNNSDPSSLTGELPAILLHVGQDVGQEELQLLRVPIKINAKGSPQAGGFPSLGV